MIRPEERYISANGLTFHLIDWGGHALSDSPPGSRVRPWGGKWLILLHGLASQAHMFDLVAPLLTDSFRVMAIDQRGHGLSDKPDSGYDFATVASDLDAILNVLRIDRAVLAGHSWGGNVAVQYAADQPDRVSGLILIDGGFLQMGDRLDWPSAEKFLEPPDLIGMPVDEFRAGMKGWMGSAWSPEAEAITLRNFEIRADGTIAPQMRKSNHMQVVRALWEHRPSELWARIQCPVLMIPAVGPEPHDARTRAVLENRRRDIATAEARLKQSQTLWMMNTIHDIPLQRPAELVEAIKTWQVFTH